MRYYQDAPELEEVTRKDVEGEKRKKKDRRRAQKGYTRFFINIGKKDHVQPVHVIEMLNRNVAGRVDVGRIDLMQNFSFFECPEEYTEEILAGMDGVNYKGREVHVEVAETRSEEGGENTPEEKPAQRREKPARENLREGRRSPAVKKSHAVRRNLIKRRRPNHQVK